MGFISLRSKLTAWYVALLGIILILFSVFLYFYLSKRLHESVDNSLKVSASVAARTAVLYSGVPLPGVELFGDPFRGYGNLNKFYRIFDGSGNVGSSSNNINSSNIPLSQLAHGRALKGKSTYETFPLTDASPIRVLTMPVLREEKLVNLIQVGTSLEAVLTTLSTLRIFLFTAVPGVLMIATLVGRFVARKALRPVARITQTAREIAGGADLSKRISVPGGQDEMVQLVNTFNDMMDRLESSFTQMVQFSSDASHELRTPLTVLKGQNELILSKERKVGEYQEVISSNLEEINYMSTVLEDLFILAKSDENQIKLDVEPLDFQTLIEEVCKHAEVMAAEKNLRLTIAFLEPVRINGDSIKLRQMIWNLLDNGIKYTLPGGEVKISLEDQGEFAYLTVQDTGAGISQEHLPKIFNRFYRVDKARSRKVGGSGLGLSICKYIVEAHKGTIEVESRPGAGTKFKIRLPKIKTLNSQKAELAAPRQITA